MGRVEPVEQTRTGHSRCVAALRHHEGQLTAVLLPLMVVPAARPSVGLMPHTVSPPADGHRLLTLHTCHSHSKGERQRRVVFSRFVIAPSDRISLFTGPSTTRRSLS